MSVNTLRSKVHLMRKICRMRLFKGDNMESHINSMVELFDKLKAIGKKDSSEDWQVLMILSSLPSRYSLISALEERPDKDLTMEIVKAKLLEEYFKRNDSSNISALKSKSKNQKSENIIEKMEYSEDEYELATQFSVETQVEDSGASCHIAHDKKPFSDISALKSKSKNQKSANIIEKMEYSEDEYELATQFSGETQVEDSGASCHIAHDKKPFSEIISVANGNSSQAKGIGV